MFSGACKFAIERQAIPSGPSTHHMASCSMPAGDQIFSER